MLTPDKTTGRYIYILSDGKLHEKVSEDTDGAIRRDWETAKGEKGTKYELIYKDVTGYITNVKFDESEYGKQIQLTITDGDNEIILTQPVKGRFGEDILKKLPALDFSAKTTIVPYSFTGEDGKEKNGVNFYQNGDKVMNFFYDAEAKTAINGYPEPDFDRETADTDDWISFYTKARKHMIAYAEEHVLPKFSEGAPEITKVERVEEGDELDPSSIPF